MWGPWLAVLGSKVLPKLPFLGRRVEAFGEAGVTLVRPQLKKNIAERKITEFSVGLAFTFSPVEVKFDYHQIGLRRSDELYFTEPRASIEIDIYMIGHKVFKWLKRAI
ncbi:MAG TPA: hypothetical protein EYP60_08195 [bacterium (Candidatus Stahlbacteria)]|nr:hypothetical protein [Candidatus Stahlbacteria bacterium]